MTSSEGAGVLWFVGRLWAGAQVTQTLGGRGGWSCSPPSMLMQLLGTVAARSSVPFLVSTPDTRNIGAPVGNWGPLLRAAQS